jgi:predicted glycosyltransferase
MKKIVIYSHDTFGLGNIRRMLAITQHLLDEHADLSILLITGSPVIHNFHLPRERFDYIKLPCLARDQAGQYDVKQLDIDFDNVVSLRAQTIKVSIQKFDPDLVLVDKKPCGVAKELIPALQSSDNPENNTQWVLLLRDILDTPSTTQKVWQKNGYNETLKRYYQRILVVGSANIFDVRHEYALPAQLHGMTEFCGYLYRPISNFPEKHDQLNQLCNKQTVLVTPGGGEDGFQLINHYLNGLKQHPLPNGYKSLIVTGPEMSTDLQQRIQSKASQLVDVEVKIFTANLQAYMAQSSLIISMAGYNTLCEILSLNKRAIVVPRVRPVQEQLIRAERFAAHGLLCCLHPDQLDAKQLLETVHQELRPDVTRRGASEVLDFNGLDNICKSIQGLLDNNQQIKLNSVASGDTTIRDISSGEINHANTIQTKNHLSAKNLAKNIRDIRVTGNTCPAT